jgi:GT2 family glycosyltransferase
LSEQTEHSAEIIVVDSSDHPLEKNQRFQNQFSKDHFPKTSLKYLHTKPGLTYQRNVGIAQAMGDVIYFFDDDVILDKAYLREMNTVFQQHPEYAGGMGTISNVKKGSFRYQLFRKIFLLPREHSSGKFTWSGMPTHPYGVDRFKQVEVLGGCCMAFRKEALQQHQFDEQFYGYAYMEDGDIARRISYERPLFFNPKAQLQHLESPAARDRIVDNSAMFVYNYRYLFFKNFYRKNRLKIIAHWWSLFGLFLEGTLRKDWQRVRGYWKGLRKSFTQK